MWSCCMYANCVNLRELTNGVKTSLNSYITVVIVHFIASTGVKTLRKGRSYIAIVDNPADAMIIRKETSSIESLSSPFKVCVLCGSYIASCIEYSKYICNFSRFKTCVNIVFLNLVTVSYNIS